MDSAVLELRTTRALLELGGGFYVRAGRSSSGSSPPGMSAFAERRFRARGAVVAKLLMATTLAELGALCKGPPGSGIKGIKRMA